MKTLEEQQLIIKTYQEVGSIIQTSKILHSSQNTIRRILNEHGIVDHYRLFREFKYKPYIDLYLNQSKTLTDFCLDNKLNLTTFSKVLKENGHEVLNPNQILRIDPTVFDSIDTEEKAYWLGFLYADGAVGTNNHLIYLGLAKKDEKHVQKFANFLKFTGKLYYGISKSSKIGNFENVKFQVSNKHLHDRLIELGCVAKKSTILTFPSISIFKSNDLIRHFIRGYIDGDGTLTFNSTTNQPAFSAVGTQSFLQELIKYLPHQAKVSQSQVNLYHFTLHNGKKKQKATDCMKYLYDNASIYLDRKYQRYLQYCRLVEESTGLSQGKIGEGCDANPEITEQIT